MRTFQFMFGLLKGQRVRYYTAIALGIIISVIPLANNYLVKIIVDEVIVKKQTNLLVPILGILLVFVLLRVGIWYYVRYVIETVGQKIMLIIRTLGFKKILSLDFGFFDRTRTGDLMTRMTADLDLIRHFFSYVLYTMAEQSVIFIGALVLMGSATDMTFLIFAGLVLPTASFMALKLAFGIKPKFAAVREMRAKLNTVAQENIEANRVVKAFGREDFENKKMDRASSEFKQANFDVNKVWRTYMPFLSNMQTLFTVYIIVVGGMMVIKGQMSVGSLVMFNGMIWMITGPLTQFGTLANDTANCFTSAEKIRDLLETKPEIRSEANQGEKHIRPQGNFDFINVNFGYENQDGALHNINLHIRKGEKIALVGPTGAGKSTIINLISRFYDVKSGQILVDGVDIRQYDLRSLRDSIASAQQDVFLFSETIAGNIAYGKTNATMHDIEEAARAAKADEFISDTPDGYETVVGERGMGLSGGQKQRLTLARALLKQPAVLVLDDTTSALDAATEQKIQQSLQQHFSDKTVFIISQRIASVKDCDQIIVLDRGRIIERGTHEELLKHHGYYYHVYEHQYGQQALA